MKLTVITAVLLAAFTLAGCQRAKQLVAPPPAYAPSENFGDGGATRCGTTHCHKQLPPCK